MLADDSSQILRQYESWLGVVERLRAYAPEFVEAHLPRARAYQLRYLARRAVQLGDGAMALHLLADAARSSPAALAAEPVKTLTTLGAGLVGAMLGRERFARIAGRAAGGSLVA